MIATLLRRKFVRDAASLQAATLFQGGCYLATSVLTAKFLGPEQLGRWVTTREVYNFGFLFVTAGLVPAAVTVYSQAVGAGDRRLAAQTLAAMAKVGFGAAVALASLMAWFGPLLGERIYADREIGVLAALLAASGVFEVFRSVVTAALQGSRLMAWYSRLDITANALRVLLVGLVLWLGWGIPGLAGAFVAHLALAAALAATAFRRARRAGGETVPPSAVSILAALPAAPVRLVLGTSPLLALNKAMNTLVPRLAMLLIPAHAARRAHAMTDNGHYAVAHVLSWAVSLLLAGIAQSLLPAVGQKMGRERLSFDEMGPVLRRVSLVSGAFMAGATALSIPVMYLVVQYVYGPAYSDSFRYYLLLSIGNVALGFSVVIDSFFLYSGQMARVVLFNLVVASLAALGIAYGAAAHGPTGAALAAGLSRWLSLFHLGYIAWYFRVARRAASRESP